MPREEDTGNVGLSLLKAISWTRFACSVIVSYQSVASSLIRVSGNGGLIRRSACAARMRSNVVGLNESQTCKANDLSTNRP